MSQYWERLLFMHWPVSVDAMRAHLPPALAPDVFDGHAWIGVVPFSMRGVRARFLPPIPGTSAFLELNVRTYVTVDGEPGVYFFSLDAAHKLAVRVARRCFGLPYMDADMTIEEDGDTITYRSTRTHAGEPAAAFDVTYRPTGPVYESDVGGLDWFLTERYCLYTADGKQARIAHVRWPLQPAEAEVRTNTMSPLALPDTSPLLHYAHSIRARIEAPRRLVSAR